MNKKGPRKSDLVMLVILICVVIYMNCGGG